MIKFFKRYDLTDEQSRAEEGKLVQVGDKQVLRVIGTYSFVGDDGKIYKVNYAADENGFQPTMTEKVQKSNIRKAMMSNQIAITKKKKNDLSLTLIG